MKRIYPSIFRRLRQESAFTLMELLASLSITGLILTAMVNSITRTSTQARDNEVIIHANEVARAILDTMAFDIRLVGAGMPMGQAAFPMESYAPVAPPGMQWLTNTSATSQVMLGDAAWPIMPGSDATHIYLRLNERGVETVLANDYNPGSGLTFTVLDTSDFVANDILYISDRRENGCAGLRGLVTNVNSSTKQITISGTSGPNYPANTIFGAGSSVNRVSTVSYVSTGNATNGIQMAISDYDSTLRTLYPNSSFSLVYKNRTTGTAMTMPTAADNLCNFIPPVPASGGIGSDPCGVAQATNTPSTNKDITDLASIVITVNVTGERLLSSGTNYTATATQEVSLRNFLVSY